MPSLAHKTGPLLSSASVWLLLPPLVYFASQGEMWFQTVADNNETSGSFALLLAHDQSAENLAMIVPIFAILVGLALPLLPRIRAACGRVRLLLAQAALAIASAAWSQFPVATMKYAVCLGVNTLFAFYLCCRFNPRQQVKLLSALGWFCLAFTAVLALVFPRYGIDHVGSTGAWRGMYAHKNICAMMTVFLLSGSFFMPAPGLGAKCVRALFAAASIAVILLSQSATGLILLLVLVWCVVVSRLVQRTASRDKASMAAFALIATILLGAVMVLNYDQLSRTVGKDPTLSGRTQIWAAAFQSFVKQPFIGFGYRGFWNGYQGESANVALTLGSPIAHAHNGFFNVALDLGAAGVLLVVLSMAQAFRRGLAAGRSSLEAQPKSWYLTIIILVIVANMDEAAMMVPNDLIWILYLVACMALAGITVPEAMDANRV